MDVIQKKIDEALDDKKEAEARRTTTLQEKQQATRATTEGYQAPFKAFLKEHHPILHQLGEDNAWELPPKTLRKQEQEFRGFTPHQRNIIKEAKEWYIDHPNLRPGGDVGASTSTSSPWTRRYCSPTSDTLQEPLPYQHHIA